MLVSPCRWTHSSPPVPPFLLMHNLSPKHTARSDITKLKVTDSHHMDDVKMWLETCLSHKKVSHVLLDIVAAVTAIHKTMGLCYEQCITGQQNLGGYYLVHRIQYRTAARTWFSYSSNTYITNNTGLVTTGMICKLQAICSTAYWPHHIRKGNRLACISIHVGAEPGEETKLNLFFEHYKCGYCFSFFLTIISILR